QRRFLELEWFSLPNSLDGHNDILQPMFRTGGHLSKNQVPRAIRQRPTVVLIGVPAKLKGGGLRKFARKLHGPCDRTTVRHNHFFIRPSGDRAAREYA